MIDATVHVLDPIHPDVVTYLRDRVDLRLPGEGNWKDEADAVIIRNTSVTAADLDQCRKLRVIGKHGAGTDNIDLAAARKHGVEVHSTPGANAGSVADLAIAMALDLLRNVRGHSDALKQGNPLTGADRIGLEMHEVQVGILGMGAIGRCVAKRLSGFDAAIAGYDPMLPDHEWPNAVVRLPSVDDVLTQSRLLFLHMPLTEETRHIIDDAALRSMPEGGFIINCARGGIVDETALAAALREGRLAGAASDVFETEPPARDNPLLALPNFLATPHIGASTNAGLVRVGVSIAHKVIESLRASL